MKSFLNFLSYHNAVPITVALVLLGAGSAFAATNPSALYSAQQQVLSVDNTYLVGKDLSQYAPNIQITGVSEDADNYYVAYNFTTIDIVDSVWKDIMKVQSLTVSKAQLGDKDLGLYVTGQLRDLASHESERLAESQQQARQQISQKQVATVYGGLIGKFLDEKTETLPGYQPVIPEPVAAPTEPASPAAEIPTTASPSDTPQQSGLTEDQIDDLIRQRINEYLAQHNSQNNPAPEQPPADTPPPPADTPSVDTPAVTPPDSTATSTGDTSSVDAPTP